MLFIKQYKLLLGILFIGLLIGCSKSPTDSNENGGGSGDTPESPVIKIETSISEDNSDSYAASTKALVETSGLMGLSFVFLPGSYEINGDTWTRSSSYEGLTMIFTVTDLGDHYQFEIHYNGTSNSVTYNNFLQYSSTYNKDLSNLIFTWYYTNDGTSGKKYLDYVYTKYSANGKQTVDYSTYGSDEANTKASAVNIVVNQDKSGTYKLFYGNDNKPSISAQWAADGSGSYTTYTYNPDNSVVHTWNP